MEKLLTAIFAALLGIGPLILLVIRDRRKRKRESRSPFTEKLMRPAGESLRTKIEQINDKLGEALAQYVLTAAFVPLGVFLSQLNKTGISLWSILVILCCVEGPFLFYFGRKILKLRNLRNNYELGFQGERAVGEELNQLLADGCRVYHDLTFESKAGENFNIDHVVLSAMGVFAIETKTRRKKADIVGVAGSKIKFDGRTVTMPWGENAYGLEQAQRNANELSQWLTKAVGERVRTHPVLTFPGWFIHAEGKGDVSVLNPKQIKHLVVQNGHQPLFNEQLVSRISIN